MAYSLLATDAKGGTSNGVTTDGVDTTGADLIVLNVSFAAFGGALTVSDSKGNSWAGLTQQTESGAVANRLFYSRVTAVGAAHTFTASGTGIFPSIQVLAFSGSVASPFDAENGAHSASASTLATGSVSPAEDNELIVAGLDCYDQGTSVSIDSGLTATVIPYSPGNCLGGGIAYKIQTTAAAINPTWNITSATFISVSIATFKAAAASAAGLKLNSSLNGLGASGPFFHDRLSS